MDAVNDRWSDHPWFKSQFCRFKAIDGQEDAELEQVKTEKLIEPQLYQDVMQFKTYLTSGQGLSKGSVALYASHIKVLKEIVKDDSIEYGVVAEDDTVAFSPYFEEFFHKWIPELNSTGFVYYQSCETGWEDHTPYPFWAGKPHLYSSHRDMNVPVIHQFVNDTIYLAGLYAVTKKGAQTLLDQMTPMKENVQYDTALSNSMKTKKWIDTGLDVKLYSPPLAQQMAMDKWYDSDVQDDEAEYQKTAAEIRGGPPDLGDFLLTETAEGEITKIPDCKF